jgi:hemolysin D
MGETFLRVHRGVVWALILFFAFFCIWAFAARLDIVVVAHGKLVPSNFVQVAQPSEDGIIRQVLVRDGETVEAGQALIEMDSVYVQEDSFAASAEVESLRLRLQRIEAELGGHVLNGSSAVVMAEFAIRSAAQAALVDEVRRQSDRARAELLTAQSRMGKYRELLPLAARQVEMLEQLRGVGFISEAAHNEKRLAHIEVARELDVQKHAVQVAQEALRQADAALTRVVTSYRQQLAIERADALLQLAQAEALLKKHAHRAELQILRAPVAGIVTGLTARSSGQVVTAGTPLLSLVPKGEPLRFEGWLRNEDTAFVVPSMAAKVKLAAYPFQKYGWLDGELSWLGADAETPEAMRSAQGEPLFYRVRVSLPAQSLDVEGRALDAKPGMQATADLHVGTRSLFEYLTSPLRKIALEAAREK